MLALTRSNLMMMARNRQGLFWALFFPLLLVVVFGLIDFNGVVPAPVAVVDLSDGSRAQVFRERLADVEFLEVEDFVRTDMAEALREGDLGYLIVIPPGFDETAAAVGEPGHDPVGLVYTSRNPDRNQLVEAAVRGLVAEVWSEGQPVQASRLTTANVIDVPEVDYFDTVLLGLLGLGIMTNSIISIAVRISTYRNQAILKRLLATPLPIWKFFASEIAAPPPAGPRAGRYHPGRGGIRLRGQASRQPGVGVVDHSVGKHRVPEHRLYSVRMGPQSRCGVGHGERGGPAHGVLRRHLFLHHLPAVGAALRRRGPAPDPNALRPAGGRVGPSPDCRGLAPTGRLGRLGGGDGGGGHQGFQVQLVTSDLRPVKRNSSQRLARSLCVTLVVLAMASGVGLGCEGDSGAVRGIVIEVVDRDIAEIETLRIRDGDGKLWSFTTEGSLGKNGSHLRSHQLQGESILVAWVRKGDALVAIQLRD